jgi:hypothetical protein
MLSSAIDDIYTKVSAIEAAVRTGQLRQSGVLNR